VVVAVFAVLAMHVAAYDVIDVAVVRNRDVLAADAVHVIARVGIARVPRIARHHVAVAEFVLVDMVAVRMMEMSVVHVVHVIVVDDGDVTAIGAVHVIVPVMDVEFGRIGHTDCSRSRGSAAC
jgi:hypothetical protein